MGISGGKAAAEEITIPDVSATVDQNGDNYLGIVAANLLYDDYLHVHYAVDMNLNGDMNAEKIKMLFWKGPTSEYTKDNEEIIYVAHIDDKNNTLGTRQSSLRLCHTDLYLMLLQRLVLRRGVCPGETNLLGIDSNRLCGIFASHILYPDSFARGLRCSAHADD
jgi:hypothetical protein